MRSYRFLMWKYEPRYGRMVWIGPLSMLAGGAILTAQFFQPHSDVLHAGQSPAHVRYMAGGTYIDGAILGIGLNEPTYPAGTATMATRPM